jgi:drug/metabolite transporter (DMT)-like permease
MPTPDTIAATPAPALGPAPRAATGRPSAAGLATRLDARDGLAVLYLAVAVTAAAFVMWYPSVGRLGASRAGLLTGVAPVAAAATGVRLGGPARGDRRPWAYR